MKGQTSGTHTLAQPPVSEFFPNNNKPFYSIILNPHIRISISDLTFPCSNFASRWACLLLAITCLCKNGVGICPSVRIPCSQSPRDERFTHQKSSPLFRHLKYTIPLGIILGAVYKPLLSRLDVFKLVFMITVSLFLTA
jgi:hypothetical protein